jgi:hypothetical protein
MTTDKKGLMISATAGGVSGEHATAQPIKFLVGPSTEDQFNTAHLPLVAIACWRTDDSRFAFDSSFPSADLDFVGDACNLPVGSDPPDDIRTELCDLIKRIKEHPGCPLSVFGHADPVGNDDYNKLLSGRRATVIYALLIFNDDPDKAVNLWKRVASEESWGKDHHEMMQSFTGLPPGTSTGDLTRAYMKKLFPPELSLTKEDFLAQGEDSGGKGDYQGCGEFNPILVFSKETQDNFDEAQRRNSEDDQAVLKDRNAQNATNRRVLVLMFRKGTKVEPTKWPCPRATEGVTGCKKRFFSDGEKRRSTHLPDKDRKFVDTNDTFACRFYQRISGNSPCERPIDPTLCHLDLALTFENDGSAIANLPFKVRLDDRVSSGTTDANGRFLIDLIPPDDYLLEIASAKLFVTAFSRQEGTRIISVVGAPNPATS